MRMESIKAELGGGASCSCSVCRIVCSLFGPRHLAGQAASGDAANREFTSLVVGRGQLNFTANAERPDPFREGFNYSRVGAWKSALAGMACFAIPGPVQDKSNRGFPDVPLA